MGVMQLKPWIFLEEIWESIEMNICQVSEVCGMYVCIYTYIYTYVSFIRTDLVTKLSIRASLDTLQICETDLLLEIWETPRHEPFQFPSQSLMTRWWFPTMFVFTPWGNYPYFDEHYFDEHIFQLSPFALVARNCSAREIGLYEKQSSFFVQVPLLVKIRWPTGWVKDSTSCLGHSFNSNRSLWMVARSYDIKTSRNTTITTIRTIYHSNRQKQGMSLNGKNCNQ